MARAALLAKIEKPAALDRLDGILELADAVMVARGDLGVELPPEAVPPAQKRIVETARILGKPVVVATQMLESMIKAPTPTRAEVSDVATAIYDGADAVMLSAESASGRYPVEAVATMDRIITEVERDPHYRESLDASSDSRDQTVADATKRLVVVRRDARRGPDDPADDGGYNVGRLRLYVCEWIKANRKLI